jgi:hypothetical protein
MLRLALAALALLPALTTATAQAPADTPGAVTARVIIQTGHASPISAAAWTPDGRFLVTGSTDAELRVWDLGGRIVGRATLGSPNDRSVVEKITVAPDGRTVTVSELYFKDMWDNGVASELRRRSYTYRFGDAAAVAGDDEVIEPNWKAGTAFLTGSLAMKTALFNRTDFPRSALGWTLKRASSVLAMVPPTPAMAAISLTGALGAASDEGDRRLERVARDFEVRGPAEFVGARTTPPDVSDVGQRTGPPLLSPDGNLLAWLETSRTSAIVHLMDLQGGAARAPVRLAGIVGADSIAWANTTTLVMRRSAAPPITIDAVGSRVMPNVNPDSVTDPTAIPACPAVNATPVALCRTAKGRVEVRDLSNGQLRCVAVIDQGDPTPAAYASVSADRTKVVLQAESGYTSVFNVAVARTTSRCPEVTAWRALPGRVGFHPTRPLLWTEGRGGAVTFLGFDTLASLDPFTGTGAPPLFTLYRLPDDRFFALDAQGRYDTNLGPDAQGVRWQVSDAPFQSFPAQTFMRDYFEPRLIARRIDCTFAGNCADTFKPIAPIAQLNRVLPKVTITRVQQGDTPTQAVVTVRIAEGVDLSAANGKTRTGVYNVRLFRNGRLALQHPEAVYRAQGPGEERQPEAVANAMRRDIATWRKLNVESAASNGQDADLNFVVDLPTGAGSVLSDFTAYAFNEDRVKSETVGVRYTRPAVAAVQPRAFVVTIGIDAYVAPQLQLRFAASDATLIGDRLAQIPGYEVRRIAIKGTTGIDGKRILVTREAIEILLSALAGGDPGVSAAALKGMGFDASELDVVRPDDLVVFAFSGHGWADKQGNFYLVPADATFAKGTATPNVESLFSADNLTVYFSAIKASEIALIIDACHSAASVATTEFKPGPMGDAGLGQLAFDKGLRILAATQAADVALEDEVLRQGLLTYALASEGVDGRGFGRADANGDGAITLDEWLRYAAARLPALSEDVRLKRYSSLTTRDFDLVPLVPVEKPKPQEPALFDFTGRPSGIVLRRRTP